MLAHCQCTSTKIRKEPPRTPRANRAGRIAQIQRYWNSKTSSRTIAPCSAGESCAPLDHFTLQVEEVKSSVFSTENGAGKTTATTCHGLCGPAKGRGLMFGRRFGHAATRRRVGFLRKIGLYHRPAENRCAHGALNGLSARPSTQTREASETVFLLHEAQPERGEIFPWHAAAHRLAAAIVHDPDSTHPGRAHIRARPF